jgi:hypothetical protein
MLLSAQPPALLVPQQAVALAAVPSAAALSQGVARSALRWRTHCPRRQRAPSRGG